MLQNSARFSVRVPLAIRVLTGLMIPLLLVHATSRSGVADDLPDAITVATWNLEWFYDDFPSDNRTDLGKEKSAPARADWDWKRRSVASVIARLQPTILCLQEVENRDVVYRLIREIEENHGIKYRHAFIDGFDFGTGQDVAILYRGGLVEFSRREQTPEMYASKEYYNISKHLIGRFQWGDEQDPRSLTIFNCHLRARAEKVDLRIRQGRLIHRWMSELISSGENVIVTGDFNTEEDFGTETETGDVAIIRGLMTESPLDDLHDAHQFIEPGQRMTHISGRQYDRVFYSNSLATDDPDIRDLVVSGAKVHRELVVQGEVDASHWDNYYNIPADQRDISDHYPVITRFEFR